MSETSPFPEPQSPELEQYTEYSRVEIVALLQRLRDAKVLVNAYHDVSRGYAVTAVLEVMQDQGLVVMDPPADEDAARHLFAAHHVTFVAFVDNIKMQFSADQVQSMVWQNIPAATIALPESVLRLQRREFFRVRPPMSRPAKCLIPCIDPSERPAKRAPAHGQHHFESLPVIDLSVGGLAMLACPKKLELPRGKKINDCFLDLPGVGSINLAVIVRHVDNKAHEDDTRRLGCEFADLSPAARMALQRYVNKVEAESRKALTQPA